MDVHALVALYFRHAPQKMLAAKYINPTLCVNSIAYHCKKADLISENGRIVHNTLSDDGNKGWRLTTNASSHKQAFEVWLQWSMISAQVTDLITIYSQ